MKYSYFKSVSRWAANKIAATVGGSPTYWHGELLKGFREKFKSCSRIYFSNSQYYILNDKLIRKNPKYIGMISWSFETVDFKPAKQDSADILVFRYKGLKSQKFCDVRIIHKIAK